MQMVKGLLCFLFCLTVAKASNSSSAKLNVAPRMFHGLTFMGGTTNSSADGSHWAEFKYGKPNGNRLQQWVMVRAEWVQKASSGRQKTLYPRVRVGGQSDGVFSTSHQVNVSIDSSYPTRFAPSRVIPLARTIAQSLQSRALFRPKFIRAFNPPERVWNFHLAGCMTYGENDRNRLYKATFRYETPVANIKNQRFSTHRMINVDVVWEEKGARSYEHWQMTEDEKKQQAKRDPKIRVLIYSKVRRVKVYIGGEFSRTVRRNWSIGYLNYDHRDHAVSLGERFLRAAEGAKLGMPHDVTPLVLDRPSAPAVTPRRTHGTVISVTGPVRFIRNRKRVNIQASGRVAKGDVILVGKNGEVRIKFDDPTAGPGKSGVLICGQGKHTIDVAPSNKPSVRVKVHEGAARFSRPPGGGQLKVSMEIADTIFGQVIGSDVVAVSDAAGNKGFFVRKGKMRVRFPVNVTLNIFTKPVVKKHVPQGQWVTVDAGWALHIAKGGQPFIGQLNPKAIDNYLKTYFVSPGR